MNLNSTPKCPKSQRTGLSLNQQASALTNNKSGISNMFRADLLTILLNTTCLNSSFILIWGLSITEQCKDSRQSFLKTRCLRAIWDLASYQINILPGTINIPGTMTRGPDLVTRLQLLFILHLPRMRDNIRLFVQMWQFQITIRKILAMMPLLITIWLYFPSLPRHMGILFETSIFVCMCCNVTSINVCANKVFSIFTGSYRFFTCFHLKIRVYPHQRRAKTSEKITSWGNPENFGKSMGNPNSQRPMSGCIPTKEEQKQSRKLWIKCGKSQ